MKNIGVADDLWGRLDPRAASRKIATQPTLWGMIKRDPQAMRTLTIMTCLMFILPVVVFFLAYWYIFNEDPVNRENYSGYCSLAVVNILVLGFAFKAYLDPEDEEDNVAVPSSPTKPSPRGAKRKGSVKKSYAKKPSAKKRSSKKNQKKTSDVVKDSPDALEAFKFDGDSADDNVDSDDAGWSPEDDVRYGVAWQVPTRTHSRATRSSTRKRK